MFKNSFFTTLFVFLFFINSIYCQSEYLIHSHNDYVQSVPFWLAYSNGANSIEVDLFLKDDVLYATHHENEIILEKTFEKLYLDPIMGLAESGDLREINLLIDVKSDAHSTLDKVIESIKSYPLLATEKNIKFIISGHRPSVKEYANYPEYIYFDHQSLSDLDELDLEKVGMISRNFKSYTVWNGYGRLTSSDLSKVNNAISKGKSTGKPFRFWGTPDTKTAWNTFTQLGLDYINTDKPNEARIFLDNIDKYSYDYEGVNEVYMPEYKYEEDSKPKNVILLIGDGNGLAQITAAKVANQGELTLTQIKNIGLVNTASADDLVTDSAAGGTAMSTGVKTNNRAIGVGPNGEKNSTLIEVLSAKNYHTGIITTDAIYGATPSSFYAHTPERDDTEGIIAYLKESKIDFFIAGGRDMEDEIKGQFQSKTLRDFSNIDKASAVFNGESRMPSILEGRGDFMARSTRKALEVLDKEEEPFFLMIEGAQIDNGGHSNDISTIINEMLDFDQVISEVLKYADTHENTLVVITADHETGGLGIAGGNSITGEVRADFLSIDHSGVLVPVFAYGPQANTFTGFLENTDIFRKILVALAIN